MNPSEQTEELLDRLRGSRPDSANGRPSKSNDQILGELFTLYRERLWRMLCIRLDRRLASRVSPDDVLQETYLDVARRIGEFLNDPAVPFYVWLRFLTIQRMLMIQRAHLGAQRRDVSLEVSMPQGGKNASPRMPVASSESMAGQFVSKLTSPSQAAIRHELQARLRAALEEMDPLDREVLALRHFEELGNNEVAHVLGISKDAASKRHVRALKRLKDILADPSGILPGK
jgi:RNA polymerase sigma-70 factor (ECF subfamily)